MKPNIELSIYSKTYCIVQKKKHREAVVNIVSWWRIIQVWKVPDLHTYKIDSFILILAKVSFFVFLEFILRCYIIIGIMVLVVGTGSKTKFTERIFTLLNQDSFEEQIDCDEELNQKMFLLSGYI